MAFLVRPTAKGFRLIKESYKPRKVETVPVLAYAALGFRPDMSLEDAKARARQLNGQNELDSKKVGAARRLEQLKEEASVYLPPADVQRFEAEIAEMYDGNEYRKEINLRYWRAAQLAILELAVDPKDFRASNFRFLNYFKKRQWSQDYIKKVTRILNLWGVCVCRHRGSMFEPIPNLTALQVQQIVDAREDVKGVRQAADPLRWIDLKNARDKFVSEGLEPHWNWMFIAMWFGLREHEVDSLRNGRKAWYTQFDPEKKVDVLWVYQSKLVRIAREKRWKPIPIYFPEQATALQLIQSGNYKRPLNKTLARIFHEGIKCGSPRKGFTDFMLERGFDLEDVSIFLGHQNITITWKTYKNRKRFKLPKSG